MTNTTGKIDKAKEKAIHSALEKLRKKHGEDSISVYGEGAPIDVVHQPTGSIALDAITGGGLARGRIHEFFGPEGSGKTSVALQAVSQVQRNGGTAAFIDVEHALDPQQASRLGVDMNSLIFSQPSYGEQALDIMTELIDTGLVDIIILDSVAALVPKVEIEGGMEDNQVGVTARMMGKALRKMTASASRTGTIVIFINQVRDKVGVLYGDPEVTPGGKSLKFYSSIRIRVSKGKKIESKNKQPIGQHVYLKCVKNKVGMPFLNAETDFYFFSGMDAGYDVATYGAQYGVIKKQGRKYLAANGEPLMYKGEEVTNKDTLAEALHDKKSGLIEQFYEPVMNAMEEAMRNTMTENDEEDADDYEEIDEALDNETIENVDTETEE